MFGRMAQISKVYARLLNSAGNSIPYRDFMALLEAFGFVCDRTRGSHQVFIHPDCPRPLVVQPLGKDAKRYQVRQFLDMVEAYGLKLDE